MTRIKIYKKGNTAEKKERKKKNTPRCANHDKQHGSADTPFPPADETKTQKKKHVIVHPN